ncbi:MAG TPA: Calx-beta domain-containing protein, partial [Robiginitalea sp.]|nr:Calx-beta domain-containing protein [Robiginitalea sp.]
MKLRLLSLIFELFRFFSRKGLWVGVMLMFGLLASAQEVSITATDASASESPLDTGTFQVSLDAVNNTGSAITVDYTVTGSADAGSDYNTLSGSVSIANGAQNATITVTPINDTAIEGTETVIVTLDPGTGYTVGSPASATVNISSEDGAVATITATDASASESPLGTGQFTVSLSGTNNTGSAITVDYTVTGSADAGSDYNTLSGSVSIANGAQTATITVTPINDSAFEGPETVIVTLDPGTGYTVGSPASATVNISSEDGAVATITATDASASESPLGTGQFTVSLNGTNNTGSAITVDYTVTGSADAGSDYNTLSGSVSIANGAQ